MTQPNRRVHVLLFAGLKERLGRSEVEIEVEGPPTVATLLQALARAFPGLAGDLLHCRVAVDHGFAGPEDPIPQGVEVALIPPVSGGHDGPPKREPPRGRCALTAEPLSLDAVVQAVKRSGAGGVVTFTGDVREQSRGKTIRYLEYEAYGPMALRVMASITEEIESRSQGVRVAIHHRVGQLVVGETAVIIAASAPHRAEAFEACRAAIEALKREVPIWKKEVATDGAVWIGRGA